MPANPGLRAFLAASSLALSSLVAASHDTDSSSPLVASSHLPSQEILLIMRDGVQLAANVFLPLGEGPWPVIVTRTPYRKDGPLYPADAATRFTDAGYAYIVQDVRGRGRSEGHYNVFASSIEDGYDTVEGLAKQSWSNGKIGMTGGSAMGINAEMAALAQPPHLKAAVVSVAPKDVSDFFFPGNVPKGRDLVDFFHASGFSEENIAAIRSKGTNNILLKRWALGEDIDYINIPIWHVGGWYDIFSAGTLATYQYLQEHGASGARSKQRLTMGPFGHGPESGDLAYPDLDLLERVITAADEQREIRWFDYWLKGIDNGVMTEPPVEVFMMAAARKGHFSPSNRWIHLAQWPAPHRTMRYFLAKGFYLSAEKPKARTSKVSYSFDPSNPVETFGGANLYGERGPEDQRQVGERRDYVRFSTAVLSKDLAILGDVTLELFADTDSPSTDFEAKLVDIYPDGYEALVLDSPIRINAAANNSVAPNNPRKWVIDLGSTAITFEAGHRIGLHVTSSNSPRFEVNRNNADTPLRPLPPRIAVNTVYFNSMRPSTLVLPVIDADAK
jgi:predicted acyl esterase